MITIKEISETNEKEIEDFAKKEWAIFNEERNCEWKEKKYSFCAYDEDIPVGFINVKNPWAEALSMFGFLSTRDLCLLTHGLKQGDCANTNARCFKTNGGAAYLSQLIVSKEYRRKKVGELLIKKFESFIKEMKCHVAYLETSEKYKEALGFYKKHNYKIVAELKKNKFRFNWYFLSKEIKK